MFGQRARATAARLGVLATGISHEQARGRRWDQDDVVLIQATLRPDRQLALVEQLARASPAPIIVAVTGHLETDLRKRLHHLGARLAAHSAIDRTLVRALGLSAGDDGRAAPAPDPR